MSFSLFTPSVPTLFSFSLMNLFIYLFLAELGLCCCTGLSLVAVSRGYSSCAARASPCGDFSCCRAWALGAQASVVVVWASLLHGMWDPPGPGIEPMFPALASGFLTTGPPGKSLEIEALLLLVPSKSYGSPAIMLFLLLSDNELWSSK